ncbi:hypothetical protein BKI51_05160 [Alphaproteobacteria bacterium AO1-B]|nr:hypothetical protein BKI51_05160 [Alphaproteobacteria bacterium AO1-B]
MKSNYADLSDDQEIWWHHGRFVDSQPMEVRYEMDAQQARDEQTFLKIFDQIAGQGQNLSAKPRAGNYAARVVAATAAATGADFDEVQAVQALSRLMRDGTLRVETYGRPSQPLERLIRTDGQTQ